MSLVKIVIEKNYGLNKSRFSYPKNKLKYYSFIKLLLGT